MPRKQFASRAEERRHAMSLAQRETERMRRERSRAIEAAKKHANERPPGRS